MKNGAQHTLNAYLDFMGEDFVASLEFCITSYGAPMVPPSLNYPGDPPEPPEWETTKIVLYRDIPPWGYGKFEATGALFNVLDRSETICDAICEYIADFAGDREEDYYCD